MRLTAIAAFQDAQLITCATIHAANHTRDTSLFRTLYKMVSPLSIGQATGHASNLFTPVQKIQMEALLFNYDTDILWYYVSRLQVQYIY